ncbi:hypothetical protein KIW84_020999 [Lathyrus oleraceus]|uniref:Uncharacterized protein n=1 Tax=Pisum sativum TaxID=3888 RepID=A0A9D4YAK0_PEA|nr:hypothetical protein KIW84_020999 [Pisum sativum]
MVMFALAPALCNTDRVVMSVAMVPLSLVNGWSVLFSGIIQSSRLWGYLILSGILVDKDFAFEFHTNTTKTKCATVKNKNTEPASRTDLSEPQATSQVNSEYRERNPKTPAAKQNVEMETASRQAP